MSSIPLHEPAGAAVPSPAKPRWRGLLHQWAFLVSVPLGVWLVLSAETGEARVAAGIYAAAVAALLGTSATYHRITWRSLRARFVLRRLDHTMIFVLIAGTYTPVCLLALEDGPLATALLLGVWVGAAAGAIVQLVWITAPKPVIAAPFILLGWAAVVALPAMADALGAAGLALIGAGGLLYTLGALAYAFKRPDPWPATFGYHEIFHALVVVAAGLHYAAIAFFVV